MRQCRFFRLAATSMRDLAEREPFQKDSRACLSCLCLPIDGHPRMWVFMGMLLSINVERAVHFTFVQNRMLGIRQAGYLPVRETVLPCCASRSNCDKSSPGFRPVAAWPSRLLLQTVTMTQVNAGYSGSPAADSHCPPLMITIY
ncbi:hypothetical protein SDC9_27271 [bioreactor metagenome]|uniref:Uncharacterized protein n=1 Tax=bioreactor metagenome TaxID=1076179 RepID=A0A644UR32_9ZZZZ